MICCFCQTHLDDVEEAVEAGWCHQGNQHSSQWAIGHDGSRMGAVPGNPSIGRGREGVACCQRRPPHQAPDSESVFDSAKVGATSNCSASRSTAKRVARRGVVTPAVR
jgi:hypothetical protein